MERPDMNKTAIVTLAALTAMSTLAIAGDFVIEDSNSTATFGADGQNSWVIDGVDHLYEQEFYFRRSGFNDEVNVNSLFLLGQAVSDTNPFTDDRDDVFSSLYSDGNGLEFETTFTLRGANQGSSSASLTELISITNTNTTNEAITFSFFQYVDFDLGGDFSDDSGEIVDGNTAHQSDDDFAISEVVVTPAPFAFQMGDSPDISALWDNGSIDTLNGDDSYQGDVAWAFQWDITLQAGDSFLISKNKTVVPTPGSFALIGLAGLITARRRRA